MIGVVSKKKMKQETEMLLNMKEVRKIGGYVPLVALITGDSADEIHEYLDAEMRFARKEKEFYDRFIFPDVLKGVREFADEFPLEDRKEMRDRYLTDKLKNIKRLWEDEYLKFMKGGAGDKIEKLEKEKRKIEMQLRVSAGNSEGITGEMIARAREYPITELIACNRYKFAKCPFHNDPTPSFFLKNNFGYCFGCQAHADSIDIFMKLNNCDFKTAVKTLCK